MVKPGSGDGPLSVRGCPSRVPTCYNFLYGFKGQGRVVKGSAGVSRQRVGATADFADDALTCPLAHLDAEAVQVGDVEQLPDFS